MTRLKRFLKASLLALLLVGTAAGLYTGKLLLSDNFHAIIEGELYRSAQMRPDEIETAIRENGIRTVVNVRGPREGQEWFDAEKEAVERAGAKLVSFEMKAQEPFAIARAEALAAFFRRVEKPLLIHCKAGADRTGLAAAIYLLTIKDEPIAQASKQLSVKYGHFSLPFLSEFHMDRSLAAYDRHLDAHPKPVMSLHDHQPAQGFLP